MITIRLKGGMGNQMFQYALGVQLAKQLNTDLEIDLSALLDRSRGDFVYRDFDLTIFKLQARFSVNPHFLRTIYKLKSSGITKLVRKVVDRNKQYLKEPHFHFYPTFLDDPQDDAVYEGWFQSYRYFEAVEEELSNAFEFKTGIITHSKNLYQQIQNTNAICLNVRRTDFLKVDNLNTTNKDYFLNAAKYLANEVNNPHFYIFSDDIEWCRKELKLSSPTTLVDHSHKGTKFGNYMQLMIACKHYIIPNSSFAWWAIWLNKNQDKKVVAPKNWFNDPNINTTDLVPPDWIRM